jgi:hypothetical protein
MRLRPIIGFLLLAACASSLLLTACSDGPGDADVSAEPETIALHVRWASGNAKDLQSLLDSSEVVFAGRVDDLAGVREETLIADAGSPPQPGKADRGATTVPVSVFDVVVTQSMEGGLTHGSTVAFEQAGGITERDGSPVRIELEGDEPLVVGHEYLFFAVYKPNGALAAPPYARLEMTAQGLRAEREWEQLGGLQQLTGLTASGAAMLVEQGE